MPKEKKMKPVMVVCKILAQDKYEKPIMASVINFPYFDENEEKLLLYKVKQSICNELLKIMPYIKYVKIAMLNLLPMDFSEYKYEYSEFKRLGINYLLKNMSIGEVSMVKYIREDQITQSNWAKQFHGKAVDAIAKQLFIYHSQELPLFRLEFTIGEQKDYLMSLRYIIEKLLDDTFELKSMDIDKLVELASKIALGIEKIQKMESNGNG